MINTSINNTDTKNRVAAIILSPDRKYFLTGKAPNRKYDLNDFVGKGHIEFGEVPEVTLQREIFEESNLDVKNLNIIFVDTIKYQQGQMHFYAIVLPELPKNLKCNSFFIDYKGKEQPEFESFEWVKIEDWNKKLYKSLQNTCQNVFDKLETWIKEGLI